MVRLSEQLSMVVLTFIGVATFSAILMTSNVKKVAQQELAAQKPQDFEERLKVFDKKP